VDANDKLPAHALIFDATEDHRDAESTSRPGRELLGASWRGHCIIDGGIPKDDVMERLAEMADAHGYEGPLAEFVALRQEIESRSNRQQPFQTLQLTATAGIFGLALTSRELAPLLLTIPLISYALCGRVVAQQYGIAKCGTYIHDELSRRVPGGFRWEQWLRKLPNDQSVNWTMPMAVTFPGVSAVTLIWATSFVFARAAPSPPGRLALIVLWIVGLGCTLASVYRIIRVAMKQPWEFPGSNASSK
jgi:hypothetical protein